MRIYVTVIIIFFTSVITYSQYDSIPSGGYDRTYLLHLPTGYTGTDTLPLIITMHGGFGNAYNIQSQSQLSVKADSENFIVLYPEGVKGGVFNISSWNAGWCCGFASSSNIDDVGFIDALLDTLINQYSIDTNRIYATGMSNGGFMSYRLACELSDRIAAIAPVAASMSMTTCNPVRSVPVIGFHSYIDTHVPYSGGIGSGPSNHYNPPQDSVLNAWAYMNLCTVSNDTIIDNMQYTFIKWTNCDCGSEIHHYATQDGGHSWPGGVQTPTGDSTSNYINATDLMWSFFQQYSLDCGITTSVGSYLNENHNFNLFPNPSTGIINVENPELIDDFIITVYDHFGKTILKSKNIVVINLTDQLPGFYYITIQTEDQIMTEKIIKLE